MPRGVDHNESFWGRIQQIKKSKRMKGIYLRMTSLFNLGQKGISFGKSAAWIASTTGLVLVLPVFLRIMFEDQQSLEGQDDWENIAASSQPAAE